MPRPTHTKDKVIEAFVHPDTGVERHTPVALRSSEETARLRRLSAQLDRSRKFTAVRGIVRGRGTKSERVVIENLQLKGLKPAEVSYQADVIQGILVPK